MKNRSLAGRGPCFGVQPHSVYASARRRVLRDLNRAIRAVHGGSEFASPRQRADSRNYQRPCQKNVRFLDQVEDGKLRSSRQKPPLQRAQLSGAEPPGVAPVQFLPHGFCLQSTVLLQQRLDVRPRIGKRIARVSTAINRQDRKATSHIPQTEPWHDGGDLPKRCSGFSRQFLRSVVPFIVRTELLRHSAPRNKSCSAGMLNSIYLVATQRIKIEGKGTSL